MKLLTLEQLEKLPTKRLLAYKNKLLKYPEGPSFGESDYGGMHKELPDWKAGNIREQDLYCIWNEANTYVKFREYYETAKPNIQTCNLCEYLDKCKGGCTAQRILATEDMYGGIDPLCFIEDAKEYKKCQDSE